MLDHSRMVQCIDDAVQTALYNHSERDIAVEQIRAAVTLGFITDAAAAEYVYLLQHGERREQGTAVTYLKIERIPEHTEPAGSEPIAA